MSFYLEAVLKPPLAVARLQRGWTVLQPRFGLIGDFKTASMLHDKT